MTLTNTSTESTTDNETDQDWACETLGASGTISGGSDCFTVSDLETSGTTSTGTGPENYNDTSSTPNGTATVTGSGSSSNLMKQTFGDVLGSGGDITSGGPDLHRDLVRDRRGDDDRDGDRDVGRRIGRPESDGVVQRHHDDAGQRDRL